MKFLSILIAFILTLNSFSQTGGEDCATATIVPSLPYVGIGTTIGAGDDYYAYCKDNDNFSGSGDRVYEYIALVLPWLVRKTGANPRILINL